MTWLASTWTYFTQIVWRVSPAVDWVYWVLTNPYFYGIILTLLVLSLVPWTDD